MRLLKFLAESSKIKAAIKVSPPDASEEYTIDEAEESMKILIAAIKEIRENSSSVQKAAEKDFMSKLRKWISLAEDRFGDDLSSLCDEAKKLLKGSAPKKTTAPVTPDSPLPYDTVKSGITGEPEDDSKEKEKK